MGAQALCCHVAKELLSISFYCLTRVVHMGTGCTSASHKQLRCTRRWGRGWNIYDVCVQAAALHRTPLLALKSVTDIVDGNRPAQEEFLENLATAARALQACAHRDICALSNLQLNATKCDLRRLALQLAQRCLTCILACMVVSCLGG